MVQINITKKENKDNALYVAAYKTTYKLNWLIIKSLAQFIINDMKNSLVSIIAGDITSNNTMNGKDYTDEVRTCGFDLINCESLKERHDVISIIGSSKTIGGPAITVWLYNSTHTHESKACVIEIPFKKNNDPIKTFGKDYFTPWCDKIEIEGMHKYYKELGL